jgi:transcriptional regulator with XRE-family HTH domain
MPTIEFLCEQTGLTIDDIAERTKLPLKRVEAIAVGRWTPSPEERRRIAEAFALPEDDIAWGHTMDPRNIRYHRFGIKKRFDS